MDIKLNDNYEYMIINGDFATTSNQMELDEQNTEMLLLLGKGHIKDYPMAGIGLDKELNNKLTNQLRRQIESELLIDGIMTLSIEVEDNEINIELI